MIIAIDIKFNNYEEKVLNFYGTYEYTCPCCGANKSFTRHATYPRNICILENNQLECHNFIVLRLLCTSCQTTHAILPEGIIPYCFYSFSCILMILTIRFLEDTPVLNISEKYNISSQIIYIFILKYLFCLNSCITFLRVYLLASEYDLQEKSILMIIKNNFTERTFQKEYFAYTNTIFLMTRRRSNLSRAIFIGM